MVEGGPGARVSLKERSAVVGGKPKKSTPKDRRLKRNRDVPPREPQTAKPKGK
jgi:hypothetical protein